jgi:hypothetical protein
MKKATLTHEEWLSLWQKALDLATCEAIPLDVLDDYTRHRLTVFLCVQASEAGRRERKLRPKVPTLKQLRIDGKPADVLQ